jgi:hypothetical protein
MRSSAGRSLSSSTASKDGFSPAERSGFGFGPTITAPGFDAAAPLGAATLLLLLGAALVFVVRRCRLNA